MNATHRTKSLLEKHRVHLEVIAKELLEKEILFQSDLERLIGKRPYEKLTTYQEFTNGKDKSEDATKKEETPSADDSVPKTETPDLIGNK
jgi:AFG3 family protein